MQSRKELKYCDVLKRTLRPLGVLNHSDELVHLDYSYLLL